jgi:multidrug resistance efflux pump
LAQPSIDRGARDASRGAGRIATVLAHAGELVDAGAVLFDIDPA